MTTAHRFGSKVPRAVMVKRPTDYEQLLQRHGTRQNARFFLRTRGQRLAVLDQRQQLCDEALAQVQRAIPRQ